MQYDARREEQNANSHGEHAVQEGMFTPGVFSYVMSGFLRIPGPAAVNPGG